MKSRLALLNELLISSADEKRTWMCYVTLDRDWLSLFKIMAYTKFFKTFGFKFDLFSNEINTHDCINDKRRNKLLVFLK